LLWFIGKSLMEDGFGENPISSDTEGEEDKL
jgi:hypothetical protein